MFLSKGILIPVVNSISLYMDYNARHETNSLRVSMIRSSIGTSV